MCYVCDWDVVKKDFKKKEEIKKEEEKKAPLSNKWKCLSCTYENDIEYDECKLCKNPNTELQDKLKLSGDFKIDNENNLMNEDFIEKFHARYLLISKQNPGGNVVIELKPDDFEYGRIIELYKRSHKGGRGVPAPPMLGGIYMGGKKKKYPAAAKPAAVPPKTKEKITVIVNKFCWQNFYQEYEDQYD